ncbi:MAG: glycosyltransferase [Candidatus Chlorobium antarcticum]|jgi:hypothetical protein|nr:glycosyltransferase [Candidatus Chlorobium antarcticum]
MKKKILFVCGSMNQTTQMHQISDFLGEYDLWFTPFFSDGVLGATARSGLLEFTIMGKGRTGKALEYLNTHELRVDNGGCRHPYDLVVTCTDLIIPRILKGSPRVLVQEGMTEPETLLFQLTKNFRWIPRWLAGTASTGLSRAYDKFCVASEGYRDLFIRKGVDPEKLVVTSIPNFDDCSAYCDNDFPHRDFVLVCTSDNRETFIYENRKKNILAWREMAGESQLIFKLHPNEVAARATEEIERYAPGSLVYLDGVAEEMIANSRMMIAQFSSTVLVASALGKEVRCGLPDEELRKLTPVQNRSAAKNIANVCREVLNG